MRDLGQYVNVTVLIINITCKTIHPLITRIVLLVVGTRQAYIRFTGRTQVPVVTSELLPAAIMPISICVMGCFNFRQDQPRSARPQAGRVSATSTADNIHNHSFNDVLFE